MTEITAKWAKDIPEGAFVSTEPTYKVGEYFDLFEQDYFSAEGIRDTDGTASGISMKYYFYDPTKHGYPEKENYPVMIFLHGATNSLVGDICINYCGGELYASPAYQKGLGGCYLLIPIANEYKDENGDLHGCWSANHEESLYALIEEFIRKHTGGVGKKFVLGNSAGGRMAFLMVNRYTDYFAGLIPVGCPELPDDATLDRYEECGVSLFLATGKRDEFHDYEEEVVPRLDKLKSMKHCFIYTPDWVKNGDGGIASINGGVEMGQHCLMNAMQCNLMFDDGTPMEERLPEGFTGWMNAVNCLESEK